MDYPSSSSTPAALNGTPGPVFPPNEFQAALRAHFGVLAADRKVLSCMRFALLSGAALVCTFVLSPGQANAACTPAGRSLPSNTNVTCTGTDTVGSRAGTGTTNVTITVESGATVTRNQGDTERVLSVYSNSQITNNGSLSSNGNSAVGMEARSSGNTLNNNGDITTSGQFGIGLYIQAGDGTTAVNNGTITTTGELAYGLYIQSGNGNSATNNGTISTTGGSAYGFGIFVGSGNLTTNNGTIATSGQDADGFHIRGTANEAINNGEINLIGIESDGMDALGSGHRLTNTGTITTNPPPAANQDSDGMAADGDNNNLVNSGTVTVNGLDSNAIDMEGNNSEATNSGTLTALGPNGAAIYINGSGNLVTNSGMAEAQGVTGNAALVDSVVGESNTLVNTATGTMTSQQTIAVLGLAGNETVDNAGSIVSGSGPAIDLGAGNDRLIMRGGSIEGSGALAVGLGAGDDTATVLGGVIVGAVNQGAGADTFIWNGGGVISGTVDLGGDDDMASLSNLTDANIGATPQITGGLGADALTFNNVQTGDVARFDSWETIDLTNNTQLVFDETLALGDAGTNTGVLTVDSTSTIYGGEANGGIAAFAAGQFVEVVNAGHIDLTNSGDSATDTFSIGGNYAGDGGQIFLNTSLGDDSSASDRLIVAGDASGATGLNIINAGGTGGTTVQDGILVVEVGGTSTGGAFALNGRVAAGAYEYFLFNGGVSANTEDNWYLRSTIAAEPEVPAETPPPTPAPGTPDLPPAPPPGSSPIVLYRIEVPTYAVVPPVAHHLAVSTLGTFHERRGEQTLLHGGGWLPASWGRVFGQSAEMDWTGAVAPGFDGSLFGFQAGQDLFGWESETGHHDRVGLFLAHANMDGDVRGQALGWNDLAVGDIDLGGTSFGGYWTHIGPQGWYLDSILMGTWFGGDATSNSNVGIDVDGTGITASFEGGYPFALTPQWTLEPQTQLIWNHLSLDDQRDRFSSVSFDADDVVTGRLGLRLQGNFQTGMGVIEPYLKANLWHNFSADQTIRFDDDPITTEIGGTSLELGGGVVATLNEEVSLFATADYTTDLDGGKARIFEGNIGLSIKW